jgi:hypothetical protein
MILFNKILRGTIVLTAVTAFTGSAQAAMMVRKDSKTEEMTHVVVSPTANQQSVATGGSSGSEIKETLTVVSAEPRLVVSGSSSASTTVQPAEEKTEEKTIDLVLMDKEKIRGLVALGIQDLLEGEEERARRCFEAAADKGGFDVSLCYKKAVEKITALVTPLVRELNLDAYRCLARCYENGSGIKKDMHSAIIYYQVAALARDRRSQLRLAQIYRDGIGVAINAAEAERFQRMAGES